MVTRRLFVQGILQLPLLGLLEGCDNGAQTKVLSLKPVALQGDDECAVCGMLVQPFPGPKGEALDAQGHVFKFCSTREFLSWRLQPENAQQQLALFVHDMAHGDWAHPDDGHFIDARSAWYVLGGDLAGSMGATLASFARVEDARQFAARHGGEPIHFTDITLERLATLL